MNRFLLSVLFFLFSFSVLHAQSHGGSGLVNRNEENLHFMTFSYGPEYCFSDTQGDTWNQLNINNNELSIGYRTIFWNNFGYKVAFNYNHFTGNDNGSKYIRRFNYSSNVLQLSIQGEYSVKIGRQYYNRSTPNSIYGFAGAGFLRSDANLNIDSIKGRGGYTYKSRNVAPFIHYDYAPFVHMGFGYQHYLNDNLLIGAEFNFNYTFSDYIDGFKPPTVKQTNGTKTVSLSNDVFGGFSVTISYMLGSIYKRRN